MIAVVTWVGSLAAAAAFVSWATRAVLFPAPRTTAPPLASPDVEVFRLPSGPEAWLLAPRAQTKSPAPVVIFSHGNGELVDDWAFDFQIMQSWNVAVLLVEYPGYGRSPGRPSEATVTQTMVEAFDWIESREDLDQKRVVAYGRSLGGGAACALARERPLAGMILESTFTSVVDMARSAFVPSVLVRDPFDNEATVRAFTRPLLILHGRTDEVIPFSHGERLHAAAPGSVFVPMDCGHNDCARRWADLRTFLVEGGLLE